MGRPLCRLQTLRHRRAKRTFRWRTKRTRLRQAKRRLSNPPRRALISSKPLSPGTDMQLSTFLRSVAPDVSIIIPGYKGLFDLGTCLRSISVHRATEPSFEVIVVDDCPSESVIWAIPYSGGLIKILNEETLGFLPTIDRGAAAARGRILCFLKSETIVSAGWLRPLVEALDDMPGSAISGGMLLDASGFSQSAGLRILGNGLAYPVGSGANPNDGRYTYRRPVDCVAGACFAIARTVWDELDGLDPALRFGGLSAV